MIDNRTVQYLLKLNGFYAGPLDGLLGPRSLEAASLALEEYGLKVGKWSADRLRIAIDQWTMLRSGIAVTVDGFSGPQTLAALEQWQTLQRNKVAPGALVAHQAPVWPRQHEMQEFYGKPGENLISLALPYAMRLAWDQSTTVKKIQINERCADSAGRAFAAVLAEYGEPEIKALGLDLFGGCFANRPMRGGRRLSTHAYGAALDIDPAHNQLRWGADRARMAGPEYAPFLDAFQAEGWLSLGRERNFDWMHIQAARL